MFPWFFLDDQWKSDSGFSRRQEEDWLRPGVWAGGQWGPKERAATEHVWKEPDRRGLGTRAWRERGVDLIDSKNPGVAAGTRSCFFLYEPASENWMQFCFELYIINAITFFMEIPNVNSLLMHISCYKAYNLDKSWSSGIFNLNFIKICATKARGVTFLLSSDQLNFLAFVPCTMSSTSISCLS